MTPKERVYAAIRLEQPDRVPLMPLLREFIMKQDGYTFADAYEDPQRYVDSQLRFLERYELDCIWDMFFMTPEADAMGATMLLQPDDAPWLAESPVKTPADLSKVKLPDPARDGRMPFLLDIVRRLRRSVGDDIPIIAFAQAGFRNAIMLMGIEDFLINMNDMYDTPEFLFELLDIATEGCIIYGRALVEAGADIILIASPLAAQTMIPRAHYEKFAFPYDKRQFDAYHKMGAKILYHCCGNWTDRLDLVSETGVDIISLDSSYMKVDLQRAKAQVGHRTCLFGNVDVARTMLQGTPDKVVQETLDSLRFGAPGGGFALSGACTLPRDTPLDNFEAFVRTAREYGTYPLKVP
jgi:uroporphyrinogen decarboxylase